MTSRMVLGSAGPEARRVHRRASAPGVTGINNRRAGGCHRRCSTGKGHLSLGFESTVSGAGLDGHLAKEAASARLTAGNQPAPRDPGGLHGRLPRSPFRLCRGELFTM